MIPNVLLVWPPYRGSSRVVLSFLLLLFSAGIFLLGRRMRNEIRLPRMGKILGAIVVVIWAFSILTFLKINADLARYTGSAGNLGPIFPITVFTAICTFGYVAYISKRDGFFASVGRGFLAFIAGPMVFEFPFLLIVIPTVRAHPILALIFLTPLFAIIFTTLSMLLFSKKVAITKYSVYFYGSMIFVFALWALDGYSYPSNPISFILNAISKVLGFACVASMFPPRSADISTGILRESQKGNEKVSSN